MGLRRENARHITNDQNEFLKYIFPFNLLIYSSVQNWSAPK